MIFFFVYNKYNCIDKKAKENDENDVKYTEI